jgi:hypothetical protein
MNAPTAALSGAARASEDIVRLHIDDSGGGGRPGTRRDGCAGLSHAPHGLNVLHAGAFNDALLTFRPMNPRGPIAACLRPR